MGALNIKDLNNKCIKKYINNKDKFRIKIYS